LLQRRIAIAIILKCPDVLKIEKMRMVARDRIELPTRGFSKPAKSITY